VFRYSKISKPIISYCLYFIIRITSIDVNGDLLNELILIIYLILHLKDKKYFNLNAKKTHSKNNDRLSYLCQLIVENNKLQIKKNKLQKRNLTNAIVDTQMYKKNEIFNKKKIKFVNHCQQLKYKYSYI